MKRFLHALAALWPKRKEAGRPPATPTSTGLRQHLAAVIRMERHVSECTDIQSRKRHAVTSDAHPARQEVERSEATVNRPERSDVPTRATVGIDSPNQQIVESPNQPPSLPRIPQPMPLLTILMLVFFMCLMAAPSRAIGTAAFLDSIPESAIRPLNIGDTIPERDLERFPMVKYDPNLRDVKGLAIGDSIPDYLWDLSLWVVNHPDGRDTMTLREYEGSKLLVLDFWARWCAPCVASMDKWEEYTAELDGDVTLIGAHIDYDYKALPFARKKGWVSPSVIGEGAYIVNRHFFDRNVISRMVWIRDGKLLAITSGGGYDLETVAAVTAGQPVEIPIDPNWTYRPAEPITD